MIGEDVTDNIKTIKSIPAKLKENVTVTVRGEVFIGKKEFEKLNEEGVTIVMITHDAKVAHRAKRVVHIIDGELTEEKEEEKDE